LTWTPVPEPVTWTLPNSVAHNGLTFTQVILRAPTGEDIMKATALPGATNADVTHRLIEAVSGVPYHVLKQLPWHMLKQMSDYLDEFAGAPAPDPLEQWRAARQADLAKSPDQAEAPAAS
jgi:hypothetical protein